MERFESRQQDAARELMRGILESADSASDHDDRLTNAARNSYRENHRCRDGGSSRAGRKIIT